MPNEVHCNLLQLSINSNLNIDFTTISVALVRNMVERTDSEAGIRISCRPMLHILLCW